MIFFNSPGSKQSLCLLLSVCFIGIITVSPSNAKKLKYELPVSDKLSEGDSPRSIEAEKERQADLNLAPVGLHDDEKSENKDNNDNGLLKATVSEKDFLAKSKAGSGDKNAVASGKNESVVGKGLNDKLKEKKVDVGPLALMETAEEAEKKTDTVLDAEKQQMSELWQSTIDRNPDIQFVIQKLQPHSNGNHAMAATMKLLSTTLFSAMNVAPFMLPGGINQVNPLILGGSQTGASLIQGLFQDKQMKNARKHAISEEQATILYKIIRETADKLVASYRNYKKEQTAVTRATQDLADLQAMAAEAKARDASDAIEMEYTLRKAKRDIEEKSEQRKLYHQQLIDLAGGDAVAKLDKEIVDERNALAGLTGAGSSEAVETNGAGSGPFVNPLQMAAPPGSIPQ